jgi:hypothetical protein
MKLLWIYLTCVAGGLVFCGARDLVYRIRFSRSWRVSFWTLSGFGFALGICLLNVRHLETPTLRLYGFPFPIAGGEFKNGHWLDGLVGNPLALIADIGGAVAVCLLPLLIAALVTRQRRKQMWRASPPPNKSNAPNSAMTTQFQSGSQGRGIGDPNR